MKNDPRSDIEVIKELVDINVDFAARTGCPARRTEHGKGVAVVRATFTVVDHIAQDLALGLFARPATYDALIRFSNSATDNDAARDTHGFAMRVQGVPMPTAPRGTDGAGFQDFILLDSPIFVMGDLPGYVPFNDAFLEAKISLRGKLRLAWLCLRNPSRLPPLLRMGLNRANAPLGTSYWSTTPYRLGPRVVKYKLVPIDPEHPRPRIRGRNGRRSALRDHLARQPGLFKFGVLLQDDPKSQPIDAPQVDWEAQGARFHPLAEIRIARDQPVEALPDVENGLAFSPGHAAAEHFPLGAINRARVAIYSAASRTRQEANARQG